MIDGSKNCTSCPPQLSVIWQPEQILKFDMEASRLQIADINCGIGDKSNHSVYTNVNDLPVMNEKIKCIAKSVYEEFEQIIDKYEPDVAENMIPIISNVLENLDCAFTETHELEVECDRLRQNNTELTNQYEYERHLRKNFEEKLLEVHSGQKFLFLAH